VLGLGGLAQQRLCDGGMPPRANAAPEPSCPSRVQRRLCVRRFRMCERPTVPGCDCAEWLPALRWIAFRRMALKVLAYILFYQMQNVRPKWAYGAKSRPRSDRSERCFPSQVAVRPRVRLDAMGLALVAARRCFGHCFYSLQILRRLMASIRMPASMLLPFVRLIPSRNPCRGATRSSREQSHFQDLSSRSHLA
jgi:hypothetical protein